MEGRRAFDLKRKRRWRGWERTHTSRGENRYSRRLYKRGKAMRGKFSEGQTDQTNSYMEVVEK